MPISGPVAIVVRDLLDDHFNEGELQSICTFLEIQYENLAGQRKEAKALDLVLYLSRRGRMGELVPAVDALFPDIKINWPPEVAPKATASGDPKRDSRLLHIELQKIIPILAGRPMFTTPDGRISLLTIAGVIDHLTVNLNGDSQTVASGVVIQLNNYGEITPGETALERLLRYLADDNTLPPYQKSILDEIITM